MAEQRGGLTVSLREGESLLVDGGAITVRHITPARVILQVRLPPEINIGRVRRSGEPESRE